MADRSSAPSHRFCALIPAYNLSHSISEVVRQTREHLSEILVVDDGSHDDTARVARESGAKVLRIAKNQGKGWALRSGFKHLLQNPWEGIITLDGDLQHDPVEIPNLIEEHDKSESQIVIGSRMGETEKMPWIRYWTNRIGVSCISWAVGQPLTDTQSGFRLYAREVLETIPLWTTRYDTETEILLKAGLLGMQITCIPIKTIYHEDEEISSSFRPFPDTFLICMVFLKSLFWRRGWYLRDFEI
ncbi:MAG: glycosyltransferase family 2 protein [Deltaproteobacteria bacterium]|nr:MAG: glycosyltransferase family 2 protein [Deltaproteobacteria bacterium]